MPERNAAWPQIAIAALFITSLVTAQLIAVKLLVVPLPAEIPVIGANILVPAGVVAYALTFVASDCYTELYGRRAATRMVNIGFVMNFVMLGLVWLAILLPGSELGADPDMFAAILGLSTNIVLGSLAAYLVSQHWDVFVFARIGRETGGRHLWMRNIGSTVSSQLIDTVIFILLAFAVVPHLIGIGDALPGAELLALILGQYLIKLGIAITETPLVYAIVGYLRANDLVPSATADR